MQPPTRFATEALDELEYLINSSSKEEAFQKFFEVNPEFLLALGDYRSIHSQLVLHEDDGRRLVPDFFLEKMAGRFADIVDLKRANVELVRLQRNRVRFRDAVQEPFPNLMGSPLVPVGAVGGDPR